ncbi:sugar ABC transport system [Klebsiella michiganensis]|nr:sugar ABC transport system [Klebsiella michiganensis]
MMPQSVPKTGQPKRRFNWPKGMPQIIALLLVLVVDSLVAPHFYQIVLQDGRLFGSPIDILNPRRTGGAAGDWHDAGYRHRRD